MPHKSILIADDDPGLLAALKIRCQKLGVSVKTASNGMETLHLLSKKSPDLLILDINMPAADGITVCEKLMTDPAATPVPVIFFSGRSDPETIRRCEALGAHYVVKDTDTWSKLNPLIQVLLRDHRTPQRPTEVLTSSTQTPLVLFIDEDTKLSGDLKSKLQNYGIEVLTTSSSMQGFWIAQKNKPDVIITDQNIREGDSNSLLVHLKDDPLLKFIPVIVIADATEDGEIDSFLEHELLNYRGAAGYLTKPVDLNALIDLLRRYVRPSTGPSKSQKIRMV